MKITFLESISSTQSYLKEKIFENKIVAPYAVSANVQTAGLGSRDNEWISKKGNLFLSFAISVDSLPKDLKIESASIYFAYILKELLSKNNSEVFLKWPNDFYISDKKIGGMITNLVSDTLICGVGINLVDSPNSFGSLDIRISKAELIQMYLEEIEKFVSWKQVFSKYKIEFGRNKDLFTHNKDEKISLDKAELLDDGSIMHNGERIYSTR